MENENKNASAPQGEAKKHHNNKRRYHKPKAYYMTPADGASKPEKASKPDAVQGQEAAQQKPKHNGNNQNKHRHSQHNSRPEQQQKPASAQQKQEKSALVQQKQENNNAVQSPNPAVGKNRKKHKRNHERKPNRPENAELQIKATPDESKDIFTPTELPFISAANQKSDRLEKPAPKKLERFSDTAEYEKYSDYEEYTFEQVYGKEESTPLQTPSDLEPIQDATPTVFDEPMVEVVGIKFKDTGKIYYFEPGEIKLKVGMHAIVKTARGLEYGSVAMSNSMVRESETVPPLRTVARIATDADTKHHIENKEKEDEAFRICNEKIIAHKLDMKLIDAQYTFDNSKLLFYFTSSGRVDFRELVKDLAAVFRTRIELRQVGIRDEAKMVGGFGPCGRALCCSLFLTDFGQVSIKMAKEQNLSLNSAKISGICGRLMCCLRYEYDNYEYEIKRTPPVDSLVRTVDGVGVVTEISPLAGTIKVRLSATPEVPPKSYKREEVTILKKKQ